jgi:serine/threonine protein kinase, bacterial
VTGLGGPGGVAVDTAGNLYVTDQGNNRVLKLPAG